MQSFPFDTVDSTNELAKRMIREGRVRGACYILAREQTAGRGSRGRGWVSPKDAGIYLTIIDLPAAASARNTTVFTLATGVACAEVLREATGLDVRLKPINDLFLDNSKLGGILTEAIVQGDTLTALLTGIGINTHLAPREVVDPAAPSDAARRPGRVARADVLPPPSPGGDARMACSAPIGSLPPASPGGDTGRSTVSRKSPDLGERADLLPPPLPRGDRGGSIPAPRGEDGPGDAPPTAPPTSLQEHLPVDAFAHLDMAELVDRIVERVTTWHSAVWGGEIPRIEARWNELRIPGAPRCAAILNEHARTVRPPPSQ